jgi:TetR/AcrR family transcriptional regulator, tetracycline repressor protein
MARGRGTRAGLDRDEVIAAAHNLLVLEGFASVTMRRVADVLGVAPNTLYSHVIDREDLADAVLDLELARVTIPESGTTQNRIELAMGVLWNTLVARPGLATHFLSRSEWNGECARLSREIAEVFRKSAPTTEHAPEHMGALLAYTIGAAAMAAPMSLETADRMFREGLSVFLLGLELEPAPGRFTLSRRLAVYRRERLGRSS